jgi:tetratricopeptide (TPR) repeat protein
MASPFLILVAAPAGAARTAFLCRLAERHNDPESGVLGFDRRTAGVWSGISALVDDWVRRVEPLAPELVERYAYEIAMALTQRHGGESEERRSLAETAANDERIRVFPADRTARIVQGLIDFLLQAFRVAGGRELRIGCDAWDESSRLARLFIQELARRSGSISLELILAVSPERVAEVLADWPGPPFLEVHRPVLAAGCNPTAAEAATEAEELWASLTADPSQAVARVHRLVACLERAGDERRALAARAKALLLYNRHGFYEDALEFLPPVVAGIGDLCQSDEPARLSLLVQIYSTLVATGQAEQALPVLEREGLPWMASPKVRARLHYMLAMMHLRFLAVRDFDRAESHLLASLEETERSDAPEDDRQFSIAFSTNGLALLRIRQQRPDEAVALCHECLRRIESHFNRSRHVLFRSVLIYNIAQVYAGMSRFAEAIDHYAAAIELDPNYSEYYNERGSLLLKVQRFAEAANDYRRAIALSPPYAEVWTNLGQCLRLQGAMEDAVSCYTKALDLAPGQLVARVGRAQALRAMGRREAAAADYSAALSLDPKLPLVWANRAALHYEAGRLTDALADLDEAIRLAPGAPDLYRNRAMALTALGRLDQAAQDGETSRRLAMASPPG